MNLTLIPYSRTVRSSDIFCIVDFPEKREASLYEKMQRLPEEARDPGDSLQCGGRAGWILMLTRLLTNFSLRTRMRLATLWSRASREGEGARGRGRTRGRRWGRTSSAGRARPRSTTSPLTTSRWGESWARRPPANQFYCRLFFSETDQSACCSEICSRRSSAGSQPNLLVAGPDERSRSTEDLIDLKGKMKLVEKRRRMFQQKQSVSLDCGET